MTTVNMFEAKSNLSRLVAAVESGSETEIIIARNGRPVARLVPITPLSTGQRIGIANGMFVMPESIDAADKEIEDLFLGSGS